MCSPLLSRGSTRKVADLRRAKYCQKPTVPNVSNVANMEPEADIDFIALVYQIIENSQEEETNHHSVHFCHNSGDVTVRLLSNVMLQNSNYTNIVVKCDHL